MIEFRALGTLILRHHSGEDIGSLLAQPKRVALLTYLAVARPRGYHRRDTLLALLWPEQDDRHARWALNQALRHLRTDLGREAVKSRGDGEIGIDPACLSCDVAAFESAIEAGDPETALGWYGGDLLEGFHVTGCGEFERWLEEERRWLRRGAAMGASTVAEREEARGESVSAGHWARRAFALSGDDEAQARRLIELLSRAGDRAGALEAYAEFARRLRHEYEVEPAAETQDLIGEIRAASRSGGAEGPKVGTPAAPVPGPTQADVMTPAPSAGPPDMSPRRLGQGHFRRTVSLILALLVVAGTGAALRNRWVRGKDPPAAFLSTIAVFPFSYRGSPELAYLADGIVDLLSANLNGAGEIRTANPQAVLALMRRKGGEESDPEQARNAAAVLRAGSHIMGEIIEAGGRLRITARLQGQKDELGLQAMVDGPPAELFRLVDELTAQLIALRSGEPKARLARLAALTTDSLRALREYLDGERHYRAGRLDSCIQALERAIHIDSTFALAHYRMAAALMWSDRRPQAIQAAERGMRHGRRLSYRNRRLIGALAASLHGRIAEAERTYRQIVTQSPDDMEAQFQLGDLIFHRHANLGRSWLEAREPFERVLSIDGNHQGALYHLSNIAARERRFQELDSLTRRILQIVAPQAAWVYRGQRAVAFGDTAEVTRFEAMMRKFSEDLAQPMTGFVVFATGDLVVGRRLWSMLAEPTRSRGVRVLARVTLAKMELMNGRWRAAQRELAEASRLDPATALEHRVLLSLWPLLPQPRSELRLLRDSLMQWKAAPGPQNETSLTAEHSRAHPYLRLYLLGLINARLGEHASALGFAARLDQQAAVSFAPSFVRDIARTVRAEVARSRGRPDDALRVLDSVRFWTHEELEFSGSSPFYTREFEQFARAELLDALGRDEEALRSYQALADDLFHSGAPAHLRMARIYERIGERQNAAAHYARFVELWQNSDPEFQHLIDAARQRAKG
ncbi:MAG: BTAD domain-containing putative transcriptional regulator [Gemmatimonadales bacterium]